MADYRVEKSVLVAGVFLLGLVISCMNAQSTITQVSKSGDRESCDDVCQITYFETADAGYCKRGCRLFSIISMMDVSSDLEETQKRCITSCSDAYGDLDNACKFGCQHQQPYATVRRNKMIEYYKEQMDFLNMAVRVHSYYSRMMDCMFDQINHQMSYGSLMFSASFGGNGRIILIRGTPIMRGIPTAAERKSDVDLSDLKTLNYMETNLLAADNSATPDIKNSQVGPNMIDGDYMMDDERRKPEVDLLTCLSMKTGMSKTTVLFLFGTIIFGTVWYCVASIMTSNSGKAKNISLPSEKLNIYGDLDYLCPLDEKPPTYLSQTLEPTKCAPPLPIKIKIQEI